MITSSGAPFQRGFTFYNGGTINTSDYAGIQLEGQVVVFPAVQPGSGASSVGNYSGADVKAKIVRNTSGVALLPKRLVSYASGSSKRVDGYTNTTAGVVAGVVDPFLPAAGVPNGDLFYIILEDDDCLLTTALESSTANNTIAVGNILYAVTAAASTSTTGGRPIPLNTAGTFTAAQTTDGTATAILLNNIGRAKSAKTSGQTASDLLVHLRIKS